MRTILTGVILAGLFAVAGCSQIVEQPATTNTNGADTPATTEHDDHMGPGHMHGTQGHGPVHMDGRGE
jgi:hypothetical protein